MERFTLRKQRRITKRIVIKGQLVLDTPTCLSSGDPDDAIDLALLRDSLENKALLTGASIAGALRNYLREYKEGYEGEDTSLLFGCQRSDENGDQSPLIINDAISNDPLKSELRDGVKIDSSTRTAEEGGKYDLELLEAGTQFDLMFELLIDGEDNNRDQLLKELAIALSGLEKGEISLGMKKRRGFGRCHVKEWQVWQFDLTEKSDRTAWLTFERVCVIQYAKEPQQGEIADIFKLNKEELRKLDRRDRFTLRAKFELTGSLLIRSGQYGDKKAPDVVHLKSYRPKDKQNENVLSGTSLAGVLRHRAERIVNTLNKPPEIIDNLFGPDFSKDKNEKAKASRLIVEESLVKDAEDLVQNRIAIDRFTGGAYHGALFDEQAIWGGTVEIELELRSPQEHEKGLLLLLLKDLWTSDLPIGGESSIGRGRLQGICAKIIHKEKQWEIEQKEKKRLALKPEDEAKGILEEFVSALVKYSKENNHDQNLS